MNWNFVNERLATGSGIKDEADAQALLDAGITHVIDCCESDDFPASELKYFHNPTADDGVHGQAKQDWLRRSLNWAMPELFPIVATMTRSTVIESSVQSLRAKFYCHCAAGVNRGPSTAYLLMRALGYSKDEANKQIKERHPGSGIAYEQDADEVIKSLGG